MDEETEHNTVSIEVDGVDAQPRDIPTAAVLRVASAYFAALEKYAITSGDRVPLQLRGLDVRDKCTQVVAWTSVPELADEAVRAALAIAAGRVPAPHGSKREFDELFDACDALGALHVVVRSATVRARFVPRVESLRTVSGETGAWRARVVAVGGREPRAKFDVFGFGVISLDGSEEAVASLGACLYQDVELTASIKRNAHGKIAGGRILAFHPVPKLDPKTARADLRAWFQNLDFTPVPEDYETGVRER